MAISSTGATTGPRGIQLGSIPIAEKRPITREELESGAWVKDDSVNQPHWKQLEGVKEMFFANAGAKPKIGEDVQAMDREMTKLAGQFFEGEITEEELAGGFERLANQFISTCKEKQYPFPTLAGFEEVELSVAYDHFRASILKSAAAHNNAEGKALASKHNRGWRYYNADYYYQSESAIAAISHKAKAMAAENGFEQFEIPDYQALGKNSCYNFNSAVSGESDYIPGGLRAVEEKWIMDFDMVPPEGFKWFYEGEGHQEDVVFAQGDDIPRPKSTVWAMYKDTLISSSFDFSVGYDQPSDVKNLADLLQFRPASKKEFAAVNQFMKNFQFFPKGYLMDKAHRERRAYAARTGWNAQA